MIRSKAAGGPESGWRAAVVPCSFMLGDAAIAAWLWFALQRYTGNAGNLWPGILGPLGAAPLLSLALGLHRFRPNGRLALLIRTLLFGAALAGLGALAAARGWLPLTGGEAVWLGAANAGLAWLQRAVHFGAWPSPPAQPWETLRWLAVGLAGTLVMLPFYYSGSIGAGDAHWYAIMLADFIAQLRAGVFPVWVGQSLYAFNGAVSPLRYAPGLQYFGGILDLFTARSLEPMALRNATLAVVSLLAAFTGYACLRPIAGRRPWVACGLSILWIAGPGVWAPVMSGDQYMTFMAIPFVPLVLYGCWRVWDVDDRWSRFWIAAGLSGTWLCHSPVALWMTVISAAIYLPTIFIRGSWGRQVGLVAFMAAVFVIIGAFPFASVLTLNNQLNLMAGRGYALQMIHASFPSNFMPVDPKGIPLSDYQLGYALLAALAASLLLLFRVRARGAWAFAAASVVIPAFIVPVPWLTDALWRQVPAWFMNVENVWPMQRLFPIWSTVVAFLAAIVFASPQVAAAAWQRAVLAAGFICGAIWSGHEEWNIISMIPRVPPAQTRMELAPDNIQLTRYAYSSFAYAPGYFSHAYMEPWLENRLLDRHSLDPILENADAAAPLPPERAAGPADPRLARSGLLTAEDITGSNYYRLVPGLALSPGTHYALRLEFLDPGKPGTLQFMHPSMFREYMLPDSGSGIHRAAPFLPSLAFGSDASNSHVLPLTISGPGPATPEAFFIANKRTTETFPFARFWLYTYDRSRLPIDVKSWIPYRARVEPRGPAYLETPRMWVRGWRALVNGRRVPILRSRENLVMVPVEAGPNEVVLEYVAPPVLSATFWMCTSGWLALAGAGLCQLALWSGGGRLRFGWTHRWSGGCGILAPLGRNLARPLRFARGRWAWSGASATAVLAIAAVYAAVERNIGRRQAYLDAAGPVRIEFTRPYHNLGLTQPLLATGRPHTGAIVGIKFLDSRRVRLGADVWGTFYQSEPLDMDYNQVQSLVVSDSALYPPDHPRVKALRPSEARQLRGELRVELNGRTEIRAPCYAYETEPSEVLAGETRFGSIAEERYAGEILKVERLPIPRTKSLPSGHHAHLRVRFPEGAAGASEPVLSVVSGANTRLCYATYLGRGRLRMTCWGPGDVPVQSAEVAYDPERSHSLDLHPGEAAGAPHGFDVACYLDGARVLGRDPTPSSPPPVLVSGLNQAKAPGVLERFTGRQLDLTLEQDAPQPGATETMGTVHLVLNLPTVRIGRHEPLLTTGRTGAGDLVFVIYEDESHVRIGHDHWGAAAKTSAALALDYNLPHEIWISSGALFPTPGDDAFWRGLDTASRQRLKSAVSVVLDGQSVLSSATQAYPSAPTEVTIGKNRIGGSTCDADFSGEVEFSERTGPVPPPPNGR